MSAIFNRKVPDSWEDIADDLDKLELSVLKSEPEPVIEKVAQASSRALAVKTLPADIELLKEGANRICIGYRNTLLQMDKELSTVLGVRRMLETVSSFLYRDRDMLCGTKEGGIFRFVQGYPAYNTNKNTIGQDQINQILPSPFKNSALVVMPHSYVLITSQNGSIQSYSKYETSQEINAMVTYGSNYVIGGLGSGLKLFEHEKDRCFLKLTDKGIVHNFNEPVSTLSDVQDANVGVGTKKGTVHVYNFEVQKVAVEFESHLRKVNQILSTQMGLVTCSDDGTVKLWDIRTNHAVKTFGEHCAAVLHLESLDHDKIAVGYNRRIEIYDLRG